jgi:hypothetical protein
VRRREREVSDVEEVKPTNGPPGFWATNADGEQVWCVEAAHYDAVREELAMAHDQIRSLQSKLPRPSQSIRTHVREG